MEKPKCVLQLTAVRAFCFEKSAAGFDEGTKIRYNILLRGEGVPWNCFVLSAEQICCGQIVVIGAKRVIALILQDKVM